MEKSFFIKSLFILEKGQPQSSQNTEAALFALVADRDYYFADADRFYRGSKINKIFLSARKCEKRARKEKKCAIQDASIQRSVSLYIHNEIIKELVISLMRITISAANDKKQSVFNWLYSKEHIKQAVSSIDVFRKNVSLWDTDILDCEKLFLEFSPHLDDSQQKYWTKETCEQLLLCLKQYIVFDRQSKIQFPEGIDPERIQKNEPLVQQRYQTLYSKYQAFRNDKHRLFSVDNLNQVGSIRLSTESVNPKITHLCKIIQCFIEKMHYVPKNMLNQSVTWVFQQPNKIIRHDIKPLVLFAMVMSSKKDDIIINQSIFPCWNRKLRKETERYEQIVFLDKLHRAFELSPESEVNSWKLYFELQQDFGIRNIKEKSFWAEYILRKRRTPVVFPIIDFQLYFVQLCERCMPPHYERLSVESVTERVDTNFFTQNEPKIFSCAHWIRGNGDVSAFVSDYCRSWKSPNSTNAERRKPLRDFVKHCESKGIAHCFSNVENENQKLLLLEAAIQLDRRNAAKEKLYDWFESICYFSVYGASNIYIEDMDESVSYSF